MSVPPPSSRSLALALFTTLRAMLALERRGAQSVHPALARLLAEAQAAHRRARSAVAGREAAT